MARKKKISDSEQHGIKRVLELLKQYAKEKQTMVRGTTDLSRLEEWLIIQVIDRETTIKNLNERENWIA